MQCSTCGFDNPEAVKFCGECGSSLTTACAKCGAETPPNVKFCGQCGEPVGEPQRAMAQQLQASAEHRQLTVAFCDLADSTALSERLDPEDLRTLVRQYQGACVEVIERYGGHTAQYLGDGILVYFGYPRAHEDDPARAVHAALGVIQAVEELSQRVKLESGFEVAVRVGIHTGLVVAGEVGSGESREQLALGHAPNVAARLQGLAERNCVVLSAATHRLVEGLFTCQSMGPQQLKGVSQPLEVLQVLRESEAQTRFDVAVTRGLSPMVGRDRELDSLLHSFERVMDGRGQVVVLLGEAGIGKSRLVQMFYERTAASSISLLAGRCSPFFQNSAFHPLVDLYRSMISLDPDDPPEKQQEHLGRRLAEFGLDGREAVPVFSDFFSLPAGDSHALHSFTPQRIKELKLQYLLQILLRLGDTKPVVLVIEDLHWVDPSTLELLGSLVGQGPTPRIMTVLTSRPADQLPWGSPSHLTQITLDRLTESDVQHLANSVAGATDLPAAVLTEVVARTDGVPLFVEELTKMVVESGLVAEGDDSGKLTGSPADLAIPATLKDALTARLDRDSSSKDLAQLGALLGREFSAEMLAAVAGLEQTKVEESIIKLVQAEILFQRGAAPNVSYIFKHALIQDAASQTLTKKTRQRHHKRIADVLVERFPETVETQPELLAHHYTEAGLVELAINQWKRAGQHALMRSANSEAVHHLQRGLQLVATLPEGSGRDGLELSLQTVFGPALTAIKGFGAPEVERAYQRSRELCDGVGDETQRFWVLQGLWTLYFVRADLPRAAERSKQLLQLAQSGDDPLVLEAQYAEGATRFFGGDLGGARSVLEQTIELHSPEHDHSPATLITGLDIGVKTLGVAALTLWHTGHADQAQERCREAIALARKTAHPMSLTLALLWGAWLNALRREPEGAREFAGEVIAIAEEQGSFFLPLGNVLFGWALSAGGGTAASGDGEDRDVVEGFARMRRGLEARRASGDRLGDTHFLSLLVERCTKRGLIKEGREALARAFIGLRRSGERVSEAELHRLRGEVLVAASNEPEPSPARLRNAERSFLRAVDIARRNDSVALELRAALSMGRIWQQQSRNDEARTLLGRAYGQFTEGFAEPDLRDAAAMLEALP